MGAMPVDLDSTAQELTGASPAGQIRERAAHERTDTPDRAIHIAVDPVTYEAQPMIVDLRVATEPGVSVRLEHAVDGGVVVAPRDPPEDEVDDAALWFRAWGLAPGTAHQFIWAAQGDGFAPARGEVSVDTPDPLPGFIRAFDVEAGEDAHAGYVLFDWLELPFAGAPSGLFAVDAAGTTRWFLAGSTTAVGPEAVFAAARLREDGAVMYLRDQVFSIVDALGDPLLELAAADVGVASLHHDFAPLPSGNFLLLGSSFRRVEYEDLGVVLVAGDIVVEATPKGDVLWEWDSFDHLDPQRRRAGFELPVLDPDTGLFAYDWTHSNAVVYEPATDSFLLCMRHQDWIIRVDRATGRVRWRLGPEGDFTLDAGRWMFHQHSPQWQADGTLLLYDNGVGNPNVADAFERSRTVRYAVDFARHSVTQVWDDLAYEHFVSPIAGDADRLPSGTMLVTDSALDLFGEAPHARLREVDEADPAAPRWLLTTPPPSFVYRARHYDRLPGMPAP